MIKQAAIRLGNGKVYKGFRHSEAIKKAAKANESVMAIRHATQGFITTSGYFVGRKDAMLIAKESGQIPETHKDPTLYSEDIFEADGKPKQYAEIIGE